MLLHVLLLPFPFALPVAPCPAVESRWHEQGRLASKKQGVQDLIACAEHLVQAGYTEPRRLCVEAASAGGWVVGAALNARPELFAAAVLTCPSLDALTAAAEDGQGVHELGDPAADAEAFRYIRSWSPYDGLGERHGGNSGSSSGSSEGSGAGSDSGGAPGRFPHMMLRVALRDDAVCFYNPLRYLAKLRHHLRSVQRGSAAATAAVAAAGGGMSVPAGAPIPAPAATPPAAAVPPTSSLVLLRVDEQGGHGCFHASPSEEMVKHAFLQHCVASGESCVATTAGAG